MDVYQRRRLVALSVLAALFIVIVLLVRSCGGDDEEATPLTTPAGATGLGVATELTQDEFVDQGDAICLETNTALAAVDTSDPDQAASDRAELLASELDSLQSITLAPGEKGETKLANFLGALQEQIQAYDERSLAVERGDEAAVAEIDATIADAAAQAGEAARRFGFKACGNTSRVSEAEPGEADAAGDETATTPAPETTTPPVTTTTPTPAPPTDTGGGTAPPAPADGGDTGGSASGSGGLTP